jgi:DNA-binding transcriptional MerR regulator
MDLISINQIIQKLKEKNIDFGKGNPYNRLRYYTKIGWIPHMTRKKDDSGVVVGHYPEKIFETIVRIEELKKEGLSNEEISEKLKQDKPLEIKNKILNKVTSKIKKFNPYYLVLFIILFLFLIELSNSNAKYQKLVSDIKIYPTTEDVKTNSLEGNSILDSGVGIFPLGTNEIFVPSRKVRNNSKIFISFENDLGYGNSYFISDKIENSGFMIRLNKIAESSINFNWIIIK